MGDIKEYNIINKSELQRALADNLPEFAALPKTSQRAIVTDVANQMGTINGVYSIVQGIKEQLKKG